MSPDPVPRGGLFTSIFTTDAVAATTSDQAWLQAMLDVEAALARAEAGCGLMSSSLADEITASCHADNFDADAIGRAGRLGGNPVIPLVAELRQLVGPIAAPHVHAGTTSQDVLDTAMMLVARRTIAVSLDDLSRAIDASAALARTHRDTVEVARTLMQQALPSTFGLRAAGWLNALLDSYELLSRVDEVTLALQFGGAAGTLASLGDLGLAVRDALAGELSLVAPPLPWHADRLRVVDLGTALAMVAGASGKIARDVVLLAQTEIAEVSEPAADGRGASSTLPQKRNPVLAVTLLASSRRAALLAGVLLTSMDHELDRSTGGWQSEWLTMTELLRAAGGCIGLLGEILCGLEVDSARMAANLAGPGALVMAERVKTELAELVSASEADLIVGRAVRAATDGGRSFRDELMEACGSSGELSAHGLDLESRLDAWLDPSGYLGSAGLFVDRVLERHRAFVRGNGAGEEVDA